MRIATTRLAEARELAKLTQTQLAEQIGVSPSSVSAVENRHVRPWPRFRRLAAQALGVAEEDLFADIATREAVNRDE